MMEARVYAAYRQGDLAETEAAWKRFREKAAQAEVMFVQLKTKAWVGMAYLDVGRTSEAQDMADEVIRSATAPENPFILALGLHLRGMALHGWEQLDDAERCFEQAAQLTRRTEVTSWELFHAIKLSWALLLFDRGRHQQAKAVAQRIVRQNSLLKLSHDLHGCRAQRILGRVALVEGAVDEAVQHLEQALTLASIMNDSLERARSFHFLAQALMARGDAPSATQYKLECEQLLLSLGNRYQLTRLGYVSQESAESIRDISALSHAGNLGTDSDLKATQPNGPSLHVRGSYREASAPNVAVDRSEAELCGHTLVATGPEKPPSGTSE
jgi:tetratricopeptide (TPR) repeat protein